MRTNPSQYTLYHGSLAAGFCRASLTAFAAVHVEVIIDDKSIGREHASRLLRMMAERLLECNWPPDQASHALSPHTPDIAPDPDWQEFAPDSPLE
jgi:hypothetical protein